MRLTTAQGRSVHPPMAMIVMRPTKLRTLHACCHQHCAQLRCVPRTHADPTIVVHLGAYLARMLTRPTTAHKCVVCTQRIAMIVMHLGAYL